MQYSHTPVLLNEVIAGLNIKPDGVYVDCTIGGAGHSSEICKALDGGWLYGFDKDQTAIEVAGERLKKFKNVQLFHSDFKNSPQILKENGIFELDGVLVDLGVSSYQLDTAERGFSFMHDGRLDMRMDTSQKLDAYQIVNTYSFEQLVKILRDYGEEPNAKNIASKIIKARALAPIETTVQLKAIIESAFSKKQLFSRGGVSKQSFQAIRIAVNGELDGLKEVLGQLIDMLKPGGRMAVISFHSLEDRIVKNVFKDACTDCICPPKTPICICGHKAKAKLITKKPITAGQEETSQNSRSTSAKLRIIEKL